MNCRKPRVQEFAQLGFCRLVGIRASDDMAQLALPQQGLPPMAKHALAVLSPLVLALLWAASPTEGQVDPGPIAEVPDDPYIAVPESERRTSPARSVQFGPYVSVQVNVSAEGLNIVDDAANEPSIAIDPLNPQRMAIGWRQFDTIASNFRQAGFGFSVDGGATWTAGVIDPGLFRSDPVLDWNLDGTFFYNSLDGGFRCDVFRSDDAGATWDNGVSAFGGDKQWMAIDRTSGPGEGNLYAAWWPDGGCCSPDMFTRSRNDGASFETPVEIGDGLRRGTISVGPDGAVYVVGHRQDDIERIQVGKSTDAGSAATPSTFPTVVDVDLGGPIVRGAGPNPSGMLGQIWVVADPSDASRVYVLASIDPEGPDPLDVYLARSTDGGATWSPPVRINDDAGSAWQWFGMLSIAPNGRLDVFWNDTRDDPKGFDSVLYYASSEDHGVTWSTNQQLTPVFDPLVGFPNQNKIGDYNESISFDDSVHVAYAATFNGEQDVYYLQFSPIPPPIPLFADGFESGDTSAWSLLVP